jgi:hypothetical protein
MIHRKDDQICVGSYIMDSKFIYEIIKIDIREVIDTTNYKKTMDYIDHMKKYQNYVNTFKQDYNIGDPLSKDYYAIKKYRINTNSLQKMNGKIAKKFMCASYFTLLDDEYLTKLIKDVTQTLVTYNSLLEKSKDYILQNKKVVP